MPSDPDPVMYLLVPQGNKETFLALRKLGCLSASKERGWDVGL